MAENVWTIFLFVPNIIDYARVILSMASFYFMSTNPWLTSILYIMSVLLDFVDGNVARMLHQESKFGAVLDQLIDRASTMCLCAALCHFYPKYMLLFQASMTIDIVSHWFHVQSSLMAGDKSHKELDESLNPILRLYYHNDMVMTVLIAANEFFYCMVYLCYFSEGPAVLFGLGLWKLILYVSAPLSFMKTGISLIQLVAAMSNIANIDIADREKAKSKSK